MNFVTPKYKKVKIRGNKYLCEITELQSRRPDSGRKPQLCPHFRVKARTFYEKKEGKWLHDYQEGISIGASKLTYFLAKRGCLLTLMNVRRDHSFGQEWSSISFTNSFL